MKLLIDTNIVLDYLEKRTDGEYAYQLFKLAEEDKQYECVSSSGVTDILYLATKAMLENNKLLPEGKRKLRREIEEYMRDTIEKFLNILHILEVSELDIYNAFALKWQDTEDALQYTIAKRNNIDVIITNNKKDYEESDIPLMTAKEFLITLR